MQLNRIIALVLVAVCFISATFGIQRRQMDEALNFKKVLDRDRLELVSLDGAISGGRASASGRWQYEIAYGRLSKKTL